MSYASFGRFSEDPVQRKLKETIDGLDAKLFTTKAQNESYYWLAIQLLTELIDNHPDHSDPSAYIFRALYCVRQARNQNQIIKIAKYWEAYLDIKKAVEINQEKVQRMVLPKTPDDSVFTIPDKDIEIIEEKIQHRNKLSADARLDKSMELSANLIHYVQGHYLRQRLHPNSIKITYELGYLDTSKADATNYFLEAIFLHFLFEQAIPDSDKDKRKIDNAIPLVFKNTVKTDFTSCKGIEMAEKILQAKRGKCENTDAIFAFLIAPARYIELKPQILAIKLDPETLQIIPPKKEAEEEKGEKAKPLTVQIQIDLATASGNGFFAADQKQDEAKEESPKLPLIVRHNKKRSSHT